MRISDWSSDVCSSDLPFEHEPVRLAREQLVAIGQLQQGHRLTPEAMDHVTVIHHIAMFGSAFRATACPGHEITAAQEQIEPRSEEHTSELQSLMRISYAVFCLKKKTKQQNINK